MKIRFAKHAMSLLDNKIIRLGEFCERPNSGGTLPMNLASWSKLIEGDHLSIKESGVYCFWWIGPGKILNDGCPIHLLKGKEIGKDEKRFHTDLQTARDGYVEHKLTWKFEKNRSTQAFPLYVGKASTIQNRIKEHLQWPEKSFVNYDPVGEVAEIQKAQKGYNYKTQFRKPFEYLFQQKSFEERIDYLLKYVGISFINTPFHDVSNRFFWEDELVGVLRSPFNLDSER